MCIEIISTWIHRQLKFTKETNKFIMVWRTWDNLGYGLLNITEIHYAWKNCDFPYFPHGPLSVPIFMLTEGVFHLVMWISMYLTCDWKSICIKCLTANWSPQLKICLPSIHQSYHNCRLPHKIMFMHEQLLLWVNLGIIIAEWSFLVWWVCWCLLRNAPRLVSHPWFDLI